MKAVFGVLAILVSASVMMGCSSDSRPSIVFFDSGSESLSDALAGANEELGLSASALENVRKDIHRDIKTFNDRRHFVRVVSSSKGSACFIFIPGLYEFGEFGKHHEEAHCLIDVLGIKAELSIPPGDKSRWHELSADIYALHRVALEQGLDDANRVIRMREQDACGGSDPIYWTSVGLRQFRSKFFIGAGEAISIHQASELASQYIQRYSKHAVAEAVKSDCAAS